MTGTCGNDRMALPDAPLTLNTLARVAALKAVTLGLKRRGIGISCLTIQELNAIARVYFDEHYAELLAEAEEDIRTNARLWKIAAREEIEALASETSIIPSNADHTASGDADLKQRAQDRRLTN
jgi:hypothetical protein